MSLYYFEKILNILYFYISDKSIVIVINSNNNSFENQNPKKQVLFIFDILYIYTKLFVFKKDIFGLVKINK